MIRPVLCIFGAVLALSGQTPLSIKISDSVAPSGAATQALVLVTEPKPISTTFVDLDYGMDFWGIALIPTSGDAAGAAVVDGTRLQLRGAAIDATFGGDYPFLVTTLKTKSGLAPGTVTPLYLNPTTLFNDLFGAGYAVEVAPGSVTVGGTLSVSNVIPGGGNLPGGTYVRILGTGFDSKTDVRFSSASTEKPVIISANEVRVRLKSSTRLDGQRVNVTNAKEKTTYFTYLRPDSEAPTTHALLAKTVPLFPLRLTTFGTLQYSQIAGTTQAIAIQNPDLQTTTIKIRIGTDQVSFNLGPNRRIVRTLDELFPNGFVPGPIQVGSSKPAQMMGLQADDVQGSVIPVFVQ